MDIKKTKPKKDISTPSLVGFRSQLGIPAENGNDPAPYGAGSFFSSNEVPTPGFKVGDRVRLEGCELKGIIIAINSNPGKGTHKVRWDNGRIGMCVTEDLKHVTTHVRS